MAIGHDTCTDTIQQKTMYYNTRVLFLFIELFYLMVLLMLFVLFDDETYLLE